MTTEGHEVLEPRIPPLTDSERERLRKMAAELGSARKAARRGTWITLGAFIVVLWIATLLTSDISALWATLSWLVIGGLLALWIRRDLRRDFGHVRAMQGAIESALVRGEAESYDVVARGYVEFEEFEDEGACWAFDLGDGRIVFVTGQVYYREEDFPSHDFSIVCPLDETGRPVDEWLEKRGAAMPPARVIPADAKWELAESIPEHLGVIRADLGRLEEALAGKATGGARR